MLVAKQDDILIALTKAQSLRRAIGLWLEQCIDMRSNLVLKIVSPRYAVCTTKFRPYVPVQATPSSAQWLKQLNFGLRSRPRESPARFWYIHDLGNIQGRGARRIEDNTNR